MLNSKIMSRCSVWDIRYSQYVGELVVFNTKIGRTPKKSLRTDVSEKYSVTKIKDSNEVVMIEIDNADVVFPNIEKMKKNEIIKKTKEYANVQRS